MLQASWFGQRGVNRAVASKTDGYLGMQLTTVSRHDARIGMRDAAVMHQSAGGDCRILSTAIQLLSLSPAVPAPSRQNDAQASHHSTPNPCVSRYKMRLRALTATPERLHGPTDLRT